jgi:DNA sulfur modification protein DndE
VNPPVDHVRISAKSKEILIKIKRRTGLEHWNEICRVALCRSLANPTLPTRQSRTVENAIDMEWKTFAGAYSSEFASAILIRARIDGIDLAAREKLAEYVRSHVERGVASLQNVKALADLVKPM